MGRPNGGAWTRVLAIVSLGRAAREKVQIKVRQPLSRLRNFHLDGKAFDGTGPGLDAEASVPDRTGANVKEVLQGGRSAWPRASCGSTFPAGRGGPVKDASRAAREERGFFWRTGAVLRSQVRRSRRENSISTTRRIRG